MTHMPLLIPFLDLARRMVVLAVIGGVSWLGP